MVKCEYCGCPGEKYPLTPTLSVSICHLCLRKRISNKKIEIKKKGKIYSLETDLLPLEDIKWQGSIFMRKIWDQVPGSQKDRCVYCGETANSADHIVPKSVGGSDDIYNLALTCERCNSTKSSKSILAFMLERKTNAHLHY